MRVLKTRRLASLVRLGRRNGHFGPRSVRFWLFPALICGLLLAPITVWAVTLISQGYITKTALPTGSLVSLEKDSSTNLDVSTIENSNNIFGVVIGTGNSQLSISSTEGTQVQVATSGVEQVLVSDINGTIAEGDQITASPIAGVGMKATTSTKVIGVAQGGFPNSTASPQDYTDKNNQKHSVKLGDVQVLVNVAYFYKQPDKTIIPATLQNLANSLAGKTVNTLPILISVGIFLVTLIVVVSIVYSLIHSSIISVGRNPMSQSAVYRNVIQLSLLVVVILAVSVVSIYMVLRKL